MFTFDPSIYNYGHTNKHNKQNSCNCNIPVPALLPGPRQHVTANFMCVDELGRAGQITILLASPTSSLPMLSATVRMPPSELFTGIAV